MTGVDKTLFGIKQGSFTGVIATPLLFLVFEGKVIKSETEPHELSLNEKDLELVVVVGKSGRDNSKRADSEGSESELKEDVVGRGCDSVLVVGSVSVVLLKKEGRKLGLSVTSSIDPFSSETSCEVIGLTISVTGCWCGSILG